jgi:hypothetical protein
MRAYRIFPDTGITTDEGGGVWGILSIFKKMNKETLLFVFIACYSKIFRPVRKVRK